MRQRYLLRHLLQAVLFAILLMFSTNKKTYIHFLIFAGGFMVVNLLIDFIYGRALDRRIQQELKDINEKEPKK